MPVTKHIVWWHNCPKAQYVNIKKFDDGDWKELHTKNTSPFCRHCGEDLEQARKASEDADND